MDVYSTEEEQVQAIKKWWQENAVSLVVGIVIALAIIGGYRYWTDYKQTRAQQASVLYSKVLSDNTESKIVTTEILKSDFSATPYAALAGLVLAKEYINKNEVDKAASQLNWVVVNANDDAIQHIARQRLARVYLSQNKVADAEALIKGIKAAGFSAAYSDIRGDINLSKNLIIQAKENYRLALSAMSQADPRYSIVKMKLDDLAQAAIKAETENTAK